MSAKMDEANTSQADDAVMTLVYEGHATLSWGQPPEYMAKSIENAIGDQMSADYYFRGSFGSPLSKALIEFMDYDMNDTKVCLWRNTFIAPFLVWTTGCQESPSWCAATRQRINQGSTGLVHRATSEARRSFYFGQSGTGLFSMSTPNHTNWKNMSAVNRHHRGS
ncbi:hypothetical protein T310_9645 [Rasamsonia emersonii CBS 393.64]|uniref:Uncharacterized protein n=1 Tax=Rasamsonia emersonii (strain ATCC 16479 / CBS 393.64 / IMI 116815) TaxID=1408163 RepID=A0A0F4YF25_RASE3|nr:hypothetical protein T310_9645 [Rasamsonia emersonii CBS 393.64]KKA16744.1 hypothetical protein T310_9645 [Rasamsonia emersonii CBS 393.64]